MIKIATTGIISASNKRSSKFFGASPDVFPPFLLKEMEKIEDPFTRKLVSRIEMLPVELSVSKNRIMTSCVKPTVQEKGNPLVLLHGFDRCVADYIDPQYSETLPLCNVESKRDHLYQFWKSYIKRPMILVGPSLGAAAAVDFAINHPEAVDKLILVNASVYAKGTGNLAKLPRSAAFAGRLHCELPDAIIPQIPNCGHIPHVEKPDVVAGLIKDFVSHAIRRTCPFPKQKV